MDARRLIARRLSNHGLVRPRFDNAADVVTYYGAVQGQEYGPAKWAIAQRTRGLTNTSLDAAFDAGEILRTHILRPTWHFVAPQDLRWIQALTGPRVHAANASIGRALELTPRLLSRAVDRMTRALEGGTLLTRQELASVLARTRITASGQRLAYIVMFAELEAMICSGPRRGKQFTYALAAERAPRGAAFEGDEALGELTMRYFRAHGPATIRDFMWWSSLKAADARRGVHIAGLREELLDGLTFWSVKDEPAPERGGSSIRLLPIYDEYVVAYRDRAHIAGPIADFDMFANYLVQDGRLIGTWRSKGSEITLKPNTASAAREVKRYGRFIGIS